MSDVAGIADFSGKTALVTGGASGIGLAIGRALAASGARVALADIDADGAERAAAVLRNEGRKAIAVGLDVRSEESWIAAANRVEAAFGNIHLFFNNAGTGSGPGQAENRTLEDFDFVWSVNGRGMFIGARTLVPRMKAHGEAAHIVVTSSVMGTFATPQASLYAISKYGAAALGEVLFLELKGTNIGVSILCPGCVRTSLLSSVSKNLPSQKDNPDVGATASFIEAGMAPEAVAHYALDGVRRGKFYIFTHPESMPLVAERFNAILASFDEPAEADREDNLSFFSVTYTS